MKYGLLLLCALLGACTQIPHTSRPLVLPPNEGTEVVVKGAPIYEDGCGA